MQPIKLEILDEGRHHLVVNKPANMVVVAGRGVPRPTVLDILIERFGKNIRPVHRIDRGTFGCLVIAKDLFGQQALSEAFRRHLVDKRYLVIVEGEPQFKSISIDARLLRIDHADARKGALATQTINPDGQRALTHVKVVAVAKGFAVIEARPQTGRMHQIRAHMKHVGHPLVGDAQYGAKTAFAPHALALLAYAISMPLPQGGRKRVVAPLPKIFDDFGKQHGLLVKEAYAQLAAG